MREWQAYFALEAVGEDREDARAAFIVQWMLNLQRNSETHPEPFTLQQITQVLRQELATREDPVVTAADRDLVLKAKMMDQVMMAKAQEVLKERDEQRLEELRNRPTVILSRSNRKPDD